MRITIDASSLLPPRTGVGNYTFELVRALLRLDPSNHYCLFLNSLRRPLATETLTTGAGNVSFRRWRLPGPWLHRAWRQWRWPSIEWLAGKADVVHAPAGILPPQGHGARVATLHDCYFMRHPEHCDAMGGLYMRATLPGRLRECDAVICVSDFTRREALELLDLDPARVHTIHSGVDTTMYRPIADNEVLDRVRARLNLPMEYVLAVGTIEPRKNLECLVRAMAHWREFEADPPKLVCAGAEGLGAAALKALVRDLRLSNDVLFVNYVPTEALPALYSMAIALAMPSLYEGFGMPLLEAMACGTPVVASDCPALRETGAEGARYVSPDNSERWARALHRIAASPSERVAMRNRGFATAERFSWRSTARATLAIYDRVGA